MLPDRQKNSMPGRAERELVIKGNVSRLGNLVELFFSGRLRLSNISSRLIYEWFFFEELKNSSLCNAKIVSA